MNKEIKAFLVNIKGNEDYKEIYDYITNLQEQYEKADNDRHKLFEQKEKAYEYLDKFIPNEYGVLLTERQWNYVKDLLQGEDKNV